MLTDDEAVAAVLGLGGVARTGPSEAVRTAAGTASAKLRRVLPDRVAELVPGLLEVRTTEAARGASATPTDAIVVASAAVRDRRPLRIRHRRGDRVTERMLLPWGVVEHEGRWYLTGLDSASDAVRTFRMDRLLSVEPGVGRFTPPADADPVQEVLAALASAPRDHSVRVLVQASEAAVRRRLPPSVAAVEPAEGDWVRVSLEASRLGWVAGVLAQLDAPFRIEQPEALRREVTALAGRLAARAADATRCNAVSPLRVVE
jgi:predicted DNA-binding transcriptional regulator YafY